MIKSGYIQSPTGNYQNFSKVKKNLTKLAGSSANEYILPEYTPVSNQGRLSTCVANSTCDALEILLGIQDKSSVIQLSRLFVYWNSRLAHKATNQDSGTYISTAFESLIDLGVCSENTWKYDENKVFAQPPLQAYKEGDDNKLNSFYQLTSTGNQRLDDIELAIKSNHPVCFATDVSSTFASYFNSASEKVWTLSEAGNSGHAMIITGVRQNNGKKEFYIRNSWGNGWCQDGHAWMSSDYIISSKTRDLWVPTLIPNLVF
jgi:C1A family cysteine protease